MKIENNDFPRVQLSPGLTQLNKQFVATCVENLKTVGRQGSLAPITVDYLVHTIELLSQVGAQDGEPTDFFLELGTLLHGLIETYYCAYFKMERQHVEAKQKACGPFDPLGPRRKGSTTTTTDFETSTALVPVAPLPLNGLPATKSNPLLALKGQSPNFVCDPACIVD